MKKKILTEEEIEFAPSVVDNPVAVVPLSVDKINNIAQKELTLHKSGVTREKYMRWIAESMNAEKEEEYQDPIDGRYKKRMVPDKAQRNWAAEMTVKLLSDAAEVKIIDQPVNIQVTVNHISIEERIACIQSAN